MSTLAAKLREFKVPVDIKIKVSSVDTKTVGLEVNFTNRYGELVKKLPTQHMNVGDEIELNGIECYITVTTNG